jgi:hypothetical protein
MAAGGARSRWSPIQRTWPLCDLAGAVFSIAGLGLVVWAIIEAPSAGYAI